MTTRRIFLKAGALTGAGLCVPSEWTRRVLAQASPLGLDPLMVPKYTMPLVIPPAMPRTGKIKVRGGKNIEYYEIAVRQFRQQVLPAGMPGTTVWSYGSNTFPSTFNYPAFTIEAKWNRPVRVQWINGLVDASGGYRPHLLPVDQTLHWANPGGGVAGRDSRPEFSSTPGPYRGPVPIVTHVHGAHSPEESDGYAEAWYLPAAADIPAAYAREGSWYNTFRAKFADTWSVDWPAGTSVFQYPNDQRATTLWYHDHTLGMTRLNVYAGPAGFYVLRGGPADAVGGVLPGPAPALGDAPGVRYYEIPLAIQDRSFLQDGSLFYPDTRAFFDEFGGPYVPESDISPAWNPEFFGDTMLVNGRTWPTLAVEPRRYRFRILNGTNGRFLILKLVAGDALSRPGVPALPFWQIGAEGGFLPAAVTLGQLLMSPAERADVVVDFSGQRVGTELFLINEGPDEPFGGGVAGADFPFANPETTGQVMRFVVTPLVGADPSTPPGQITLPALPRLGPASVTRRLSLNEEDSAILPDVGPRAALLGTLDADGRPVVSMWDDPVSENPKLGATELWEFYNFTADAHPIHIHEVMFEVVDRQALDTDGGEMPASPATPIGPKLPPEPWETGQKDTVIAYPGQVTRVKARFDLPGQYVWHCHIVEHEDNEMMRPYRIDP